MRIKKISTPYLIIIAALIIVISISAVIAYMFRQTGEVKNEFIPAEVKCEITENFEDDLKTSVKVKNTGNIDAYIRLRVVSYWEDSKGNPVGRNSPVLEFGSDWKYDESKWIYDKDENTFYHKAPVKAGELTSELLSLTDKFKGIKLDTVEETYIGIKYTYHPVITFIAEAIQCKPDGTPTKKWNVTVDGEGNIIAKLAKP